MDFAGSAGLTSFQVLQGLGTSFSAPLGSGTSLSKAKSFGTPLIIANSFYCSPTRAVKNR
jgi:hypothetical protein